MLSESLQGVVSQQLVKTVDGKIQSALEVLVSVPALSKVIRDGKTFQIPSIIVTGKHHGMQTMDNALMALFQSGKISGREAYRKAFEKKLFAPFIREEGPAIDSVRVPSLSLRREPLSPNEETPLEDLTTPQRSEHRRHAHH
jgi:twitching motility protein PilT